jgi:tRNA nucleotidyltransferase/poly(A) polymerase
MFWKAGLMDLAAGLIRTPLPPKETFLDDPLRVMRAIRFGARFGFKLEEELKNAASCEEVKEALGTKVSRERIGHEVDLMLMGKKPSEAMRWFEQLELFPVIFTACVKDSNPPLLGNNGRWAQEILKCLALGVFGSSAQVLCTISL